MENMMDMLNKALEEYARERIQIEERDDSAEIEEKVNEYRNVLREEFKALRAKKLDEVRVSEEAVRRLIDKAKQNAEKIESAAGEIENI